MISCESPPKVETGLTVVAISRLILLVCLAALSPLAKSRGDDGVAGDLIVFNDNGAWSWFEDERVIVDAAHGKIVLSSVANSQGPGGAKRAGDVEVISYDLATGKTRLHTLSDSLQEDDHDSAALLVLPDGRYLASYSKHASDNYLRYRISVKPGDIQAWQPERVFLTAAGTTYSNLLYLSKTNTLFNFHRDRGRGFDPNYLLWNFGNATGFSYGGRLLTGPEGSSGHRDRPYLRYVTNGVDRIHFIATDHHPRDLLSNSVYHGYIEAERGGYGLNRSDGFRLGDLSTNTTSPYKASDFTMLLRGNAISPINGLLLTRGWTIDIELDVAGYPYVMFTARVNDSDLDHRFFYGRYNGEGWTIRELAKAGGCLYHRENDYTGLATLDPNDPNRLFISTNIHPKTDATLPHYEIFEGKSSDRGYSWSWLPITRDSPVDNLRPVMPRGTQPITVLLWMRGEYNSYTNYNTSVVGLTNINPIKPIVVAGASIPQ
jgi:hypothetical protein